VDGESAVRLKKYLDVFFKRKWWIVVPFALSIVCAPFVFDFLPKIYRASTTVLVSPESLSKRVAESTVTGSIEERVASLAIQILSDTFLEQVVDEVGLVPEHASEFDRMAAARSLKKNIELEHDPTLLSWFRVVAYDEDPEKAATIANRLADLFIEQDSGWREEQASGATETVDQWLTEARAKLEAEEGRLATYRKKYLFELPEHMPANLSLLKAAQDRRSNLSRDIQTRQDQLTILRSQYQEQSNLDPMSVPGQSKDPGLREYAALQNERRLLRSRYTEQNPEVRIKLAEIEEFKKSRPDLFNDDSGAPDIEADPTGLKVDIVRLEKEIAALEAERDRIQGEINTYETRIERTPLREQELASLTRDYQIVQDQYGDLLRKLGVTTQGQDIEAARKGVHFRVQDPARPPRKPHRPVLLQILLLCMVTGLGAGVGAAALLEFLDQTFQNEDEFREAFPDVAVLVTIPKLDPGGRPKKKRRGGPARDAAIWLLVGLIFLAAGSVAYSWWM